MTKNHRLLRTVIAVLCMSSMLCFQTGQDIVCAGSAYSFVVLNTYKETMQIGDELYLFAIAVGGKKITFSSADKKVASVDSAGCITAKRAGKTKITAKSGDSLAYCAVTVKPTTVTLSQHSIAMENGSTCRLKASVSTGHEATFRSSRRSVASVDAQGLITANKPGETVITVEADGTKEECRVTVKLPTVTLDKSCVTLYRREELVLSLQSTSRSTPKWKSSRSSVAAVDAQGKVTAVRHGTAVITVTVDGVSRTCEVTVKQPVVKFEENSLTLAAGKKKKVKVTVSSGNVPVFSSSNTNVATVDDSGRVTAVSPGKAYIYASEDGVKVKLKITVTEN